MSDSNWGYEKGLLEGVSRTIMANRTDASVVCKVKRIGGAASTPTQAQISNEEYLKE